MTQNIRNSSLAGTRVASGSLMSGYDLSPINNRADMVVYWNDFQEETADLDLTNIWEDIDIGTMTLNPSVFVVQGNNNGICRLASDATDGDGNCMSLTEDNALGLCVTPRDSQQIFFEARVTSANWDTHHWWVGLVEDPAAGDVMDADGDMIASKEYIGFHQNFDDDADGIPKFISAGGNNTEVTADTASGVTVAAGADGTFRNFGIRINGTTAVEFYIDGALVATDTLASAFTASLYISFASVIDTANVNFDVDYVWTAQTRNP